MLGDYTVSTVFLCYDHAFDGGEPVLFETMILYRDGGFLDDFMVRYRTWEDAIAGHKKVVDILIEERLEVKPETYKIYLMQENSVRIIRT